MGINRRKIKFPGSRIYTFVLLLLISFLMYSCRSSRSTSSIPDDIQELAEDEFFDDEGNDTGKNSKKDKREVKDKAKKVINSARSYIGTPYKYGGTTRAGMDCSGLLVTCFRTANITLPRTSSAQSNYGKSVGLDDIKEGDLVFFSERKGGKKVSHVGMVTDVRGKREVKFIHASSSLGVVENDLYSPYYIKIFVKARRPF